MILWVSNTFAQLQTRPLVPAKIKLQRRTYHRRVESIRRHRVITVVSAALWTSGMQAGWPVVYRKLVRTFPGMHNRACRHRLLPLFHFWFWALSSVSHWAHTTFQHPGCKHTAGASRLSLQAQLPMQLQEQVTQPVPGWTTRWVSHRLRLWHTGTFLIVEHYQDLWVLKL